MISQLFSKGQVALVTGAALGIGRAAAIEFAKRGMPIVAIDLAGDDLSSLENELNGIASCLLYTSPSPRDS